MCESVRVLTSYQLTVEVFTTCEVTQSREILSEFQSYGANSVHTDRRRWHQSFGRPQGQGSLGQNREAGGGGVCGGHVEDRQELPTQPADEQD